jgi:transcriptional regulator with XRE-family HTH domain
MRLRIARGYSVYELASVAGVLACTIQRLEVGKTVDKRVLAALATALGTRLCRLVFGDRSCFDRACVRAVRSSVRDDRSRGLIC